MIEIKYTRSCAKEIKKLPLSKQKKLFRLLKLLKKDRYHPLLHTKQLKGSFYNYFSFRITREWLAIFHYLDSETIQLVHVGHRKDIYR